MDKLPTTAFLGASTVNQPNLHESNSSDSSSVPQMGTSYGSVNIFGEPARNNKSLLVFDITPSEELPLVFLDGQETSDSDSSSEDAGKTFDSPTTSKRIPDTVPYQVEFTDKPSATGTPSVFTVRFTCKNAIIECLQYGEKIRYNPLVDLIKVRHSGYHPTKDGIIKALKTGTMFECKCSKSDVNYSGSGYWQMTESAMKNVKISIEPCPTTPCLSIPKTPSTSTLTCKEEIVKYLKNKTMTINELAKGINNISNKGQSIQYKEHFSISTIRRTLVNNEIFERAGSYIVKNNRTEVHWCLKENRDDNVISAAMVDSTESHLTYDISYLQRTRKDIIIELLKNGKEMTFFQMFTMLKKKYPECPNINTLVRGIRSALSAHTCFEQVPDANGRIMKGARWRIKKDTKEYRESLMMVENENVRSANATQPIQPNLALIASEVEHKKDDQRLTSPSAQTTAGVISNEEQKLALQPETTPIQFDHGLGLPLISQGYKSVTLE